MIAASNFAYNLIIGLVIMLVILPSVVFFCVRTLRAIPRNPEIFMLVITAMILAFFGGIYISVVFGSFLML